MLKLPSLKATAIVGVAIIAGACSRSLPPTENRLGHGAGTHGADGRTAGQHKNTIPNAFGPNGSRVASSQGGPLANGSQNDRGDTVYFSSDSVDLSPESQQVLTAQAQWLARDPRARITIEGHADERGTREYNIGLGQKRAESVRAFLARNGVDGSRILATSFGKERPLASCPDISCWSQNRRAQTRLMSGTQATEDFGRNRR